MSTPFKQAVDIKRAEQIAQSVGIPAQPQFVLEIREELNQSEPDSSKIANIVSNDPALSAKLLKIINSPFFGLRREIVSIKHALVLLGLKNFFNSLIASSLRDALGSHGTDHDIFWEHSTNTAIIAKHIARKNMSPIDEEQAYMAGLFHDCGVPLLLNKFPDYSSISQLAFNDIEQLVVGESIIDFEDARYQTDHCVVGYFVAKSWHLPDAICQAIRYHHDPDIDVQLDDATKLMSSTVILADYISTHLWDDSASDANWSKVFETAYQELDLNMDEIVVIKEYAISATSGDNRSK